jgi:hypothetical protein
MPSFNKICEKSHTDGGGAEIECFRLKGIIWYVIEACEM